jgi:ankyrin repeat protein
LSKVRTTNSNIDQRGEEGDTLLMRCAKVADYVGVQKCIMHGASLDLIDQHGNNAFKYAIEADSEESVRILLVARADKQRAGEYLAREIADYVREISEIEAFQVIHGAIPQILNLVEIKRKGLEALQKMQILFSQTPVQLLAPLTPAQKLEYKKMFVQREQVKPSLDGSLMLYEDFDDATALKKYLKERASIATRLSGKMPTALYTHVMSFLRKKSDEKEQRLEQALRKAIICKDEELSQLLVKNGVELDIDEKIAAQFN